MQEFDGMQNHYFIHVQFSNFVLYQKRDPPSIFAIMRGCGDNCPDNYNIGYDIHLFYCAVLVYYYCNINYVENSYFKIQIYRKTLMIYCWFILSANLINSLVNYFT